MSRYSVYTDQYHGEVPRPGVREITKLIARRDTFRTECPVTVPTSGSLVRSTDEMQARDVLRAAHLRFSREELARELDTDEKTLTRWMDGPIPRPRFVWHAVSNLLRQEPVRVERPGSTDFT